MPSFAYRAIDGGGKVRRGSVFAFDTEDVEDRLEKLGLTLLRVKAVRRSRLGRLFGAQSVNPRLVIEFYHRLAQTLELGLPILTALEENAKVLPSRPLRAMIREIIVAIESGSSLYEALQRFPRVFQKFDLSVVKMGEHSGVLPKALQELAEFLEWKENIRSLVRRATIYPSFIFVAIGGVIGVWVGYVLPQMAKVLAEMGIDLPAMTRAVMATSNFLRHYWLLLGGIAALFVVALWAAARVERGRIILHGLFLKLPIVGGITSNIAMTRLGRNFATMYESGLPIRAIFEILTDDVLGNKYLESKLALAYEEVQKGRSLADALESVEAFPPLMLGAVKNGESTGTLGQVFTRLSKYYDAEAKKTIDTLLNALEPLTILVLGGVFGIIILSVLLPLYSVVGDMGNAY